MSLTPKQEEFCLQYLKTGNASEAYRLAYSCEKMKNTAIQTNAKKLLKKTPIALRINELKVERNKRHQIDADYVLKRLVEVDQMDVLDIMNDDMSVKPLSEWPQAWRRTVSGLEVSELFEFCEGRKELTGLLKKIKWPDKVRNLELLGKHVNVSAFSDKIDMTLHRPKVTVNRLGKKSPNE